MMRVVSILMLALLMNGCSATPETAEDRDMLANSSETTISRFQESDPRTGTFFDKRLRLCRVPKDHEGICRHRWHTEEESSTREER